MDNSPSNPTDNQIPNSAEMARFAEAQKRIVLQARARNGLSWFYWIAALSLINSIVGMSGGSITFVIGLGATQVVDSVAKSFAQELTGNSSLVLQGVGLVLNIAIAGLFAMLGFLGIKRKRWAAITGILLYGIDTLMVLSVQDWFSAAFHAWALWSMANGLKALNVLTGLEKQHTPSAQSAVIEVTPPPLNKSRLLEIATAVVTVPLICLFLAVVAGFVFLMLNQ